MAALSLSIDAIRPLNRWDHSSIRPGVVGSVGDVLLTERLKSSLPGNFRWEASTFGKNESDMGTSVNNGTALSYASGGGPAKTIDSNWGGRRSFKHSHGWVFQDLRAADRYAIPSLGELPHFSWNNRVARVHDARHTGDMFAYQGAISQNGISRGGLNPRVTDVVDDDEGGSELVQESLTNYQPESTGPTRAHLGSGLVDQVGPWHGRGRIRSNNNKKYGGGNGNEGTSHAGNANWDSLMTPNVASSRSSLRPKPSSIRTVVLSPETKAVLSVSAYQPPGGRISLGSKAGAVGQTVPAPSKLNEGVSTNREGTDDPAINEEAIPDNEVATVAAVENGVPGGKAPKKSFLQRNKRLLGAGAAVAVAAGIGYGVYKHLGKSTGLQGGGLSLRPDVIDMDTGDFDSADISDIPANDGKLNLREFNQKMDGVEDVNNPTWDFDPEQFPDKSASVVGSRRSSQVLGSAPKARGPKAGKGKEREDLNLDDPKNWAFSKNSASRRESMNLDKPGESSTSKLIDQQWKIAGNHTADFLEKAGQLAGYATPLAAYDPSGITAGVIAGTKLLSVVSGTIKRGVEGYKAARKSIKATENAIAGSERYTRKEKPERNSKLSLKKPSKSKVVPVRSRMI